MKKIYTLLTAALAIAGTATAQQLPGGTFNGDWETCYPNAGTNAVGEQPANWGASNVYQMMSFVLVTQTADRTSTDANAHSAHLNNTFCGIPGLMGAAAPAYITLGDAWNYGDAANLNTPQDKSDGGSYGGAEFTYRPDAISLWVKRIHATSANAGTVNTGEKATVLVYSWKGETSSTVRIGLEMDYLGDARDFLMPNRDKDVLGMITDGVTKSDDFELISKSENYIEGDIEEWKQLTYPIEYLSDNAPEMINVVIASSDYFNRPNLGVNNTLDVDDVTLVYYSTLNALTIGGNEIALSNDTYNYEGTGSLPTSADEVVATTKSQFATADVKIDNAANTVTITVTNQGGADIDGKTSHTYVITYPATAEATQYTGYLNIEMMGNQLATNQEATVEITDNGNGTCTFSLPNFSLGGSASMGDIVVENVTMTEADGTTTYTGSVKGLSLAEGQIIADVELNGTIDANGTVDFVINVTWNGIPINVTFTSNPVSDTTEYTGYLNVEMEGQQLVTNEAATVSITDNGNGTCTFILPNFSFQGIPLGDIVVENVTMTEAAGTTTYEGSATGMVLVPGSITADVALNGTIDANGTVDFKIDVTWVEANLPINVTFTSDPTSSVANIDANGTAIYGTTGAIAINGYTGTASIYGITGQLLKSVPVDGNALINIDGGIYIVRIDGTTAKVLVK